MAYLFGSVARGEEMEESDVDIAVLFDKKVGSQDYLRLEGELIGLFGGYYPGKEINIVNLNIAPPLLAHSAVVEGKTIYEKNILTRILFENKTLHGYEDYRHLSGIYNQILTERINAI